MTTFSIVIPVYNTEQYLLECLDSIASQTYANFEVIMVDDGSTDGSARICKEYTERDSRFVYRYKENGGVSSARNVGIDMAVGEWLLFVDSDDILMPDYLQTIMDCEEKADITFFGMQLFDKEKELEKKLPTRRFCTNRNDVETVIHSLRCGELGDLFGWTWDKVIRRSGIVQHNIRFNEQVSFREDELFFLNYCRYVKTLRVIDKVLYRYRIHDKGLTKAGMKTKDLLPSSVEMEESIGYYSYTPLYEHILSKLTSYRAKDLYASPIAESSRKLDEYLQMIKRHPQPGITCKVNNLTRYAKKGKLAAWLYCLIRKV